MRPASVEMTDFLLTKQPFFIADLFTIVLLDGTTYRWTSTDQKISHGGVTWLAFGPLLKRTGWSMNNTVETQDLTIEVASTGTDFQGVNLKLAVHNGLLDGASVNLQRAVMPTFGDTSLGLIDVFFGKVGKVEITSIGFLMTVRGSNILFNQYMPRNRYGLNCIHTLFDAGCTLSRATFTSTMTMVDPTTAFLPWETAPLYDPARLVAGTVYIRTGPAYGSYRTVQAASASGVLLSYPLYATPLTGDVFDLSLGCQKTRDACNEFSNITHFRGFPFLPPPETAY